MPEELPAPLVPADVDLSGYSSFMFDVDRFLASELAALATPEEGWAAFFLWCRAWKQSPPGSLPSDDRVLASFSNSGKRWPKIRAVALRGFVRCSDGRLYHRVLCDEVMTAWKRRQEHDRRRARDAERLANWRAEQEAKRISERPGNAVETHFNAATSPRDRTGHDNTGQDRTGQDRTGQDRSSKATPTPNVNPGATAPAKRPRGNGRAAESDGATARIGETWAAYGAAYFARYGQEPVANATVNGQLAAFVRRVGADDAPHIARFFVGLNTSWYVTKGHAVGVMLADAEKLHTEWRRGRAVTQSEARQADATEARGNVWDDVRKDLRRAP